MRHFFTQNCNGVEHQKLNLVTTEQAPGCVYGVQLGLRPVRLNSRSAATRLSFWWSTRLLILAISVEKSVWYRDELCKQVNFNISTLNLHSSHLEIFVNPIKKNLCLVLVIFKSITSYLRASEVEGRRRKIPHWQGRPHLPHPMKHRYPCLRAQKIRALTSRPGF